MSPTKKGYFELPSWRRRNGRTSQSNPLEELRAELEEERARNEALTRQHELENARKEEKVQKLAEKVGRVFQSLSRLQKERKIIVSNRERAEKENLHLRKLLQIRDRELQSLNLQRVIGNSRDTSSEYDSLADLDTAMNDTNMLNLSGSSDLPSSPGSVNMSIPEPQVSKMMTNLELQLSLRDEQVEKLKTQIRDLKERNFEHDALEKMLRENEAEKTIMKGQLERMEGDYQVIMTAMSQCFENMRLMANNFKLKEAERTEVIWEANGYMAEQRALHLINCKKMAKELHRLHLRVRELEDYTGSIIIDTENAGEVNRSVSLDNIVLDNSRSIAFALLEKEHEKHLDRLQREHEQRMAEVKDELNTKITELSKALLEKDRLIAALKEDMDGQMDRVMSMSTEINRLHDPEYAHLVTEKDTSDEEFLRKIQEEEERVRSFHVDQLDSPFGDEPGPSTGPFHNLFHLDETPIKKRVTVVEDVASPRASEPAADGAASANQIVAVQREKSSMLTKIAEASEKIHALESQLQHQEATVDLLKTNLTMMEQTSKEKDRKIQELLVKDRHACDDTDTTADSLSMSLSGDSKKDETTALRSELDVLRENFAIETKTMQSMIKVLNGQVYKAMKAVEEERRKSSALSAQLGLSDPEEPRRSPIESPNNDEKISSFKRELEDLHRRSQMALQLSQAEVAALKSQLEERKSELAGEPHSLGLDWLSVSNHTRLHSPEKLSQPYS